MVLADYGELHASQRDNVQRIGWRVLGESRKAGSDREDDGDCK